MVKCIVVLGMHRSGTSALMGVLKSFSVEMGSNHIIPRPGNPKGFFELTDINNLNDKIFDSLHSSWDSLNPLPEDWSNGSGIDGHRKALSEIIKTNFENAGMISIKDPRLCRLLPLWSEVFEELGISPYFIIPLRHPLEVAGSLGSRNGFSLKKSLLLWMTYMLDAELYSRKYPRVFTTYYGLLKDTANTMDSISKTLNIKFPKSYEDVKEEVSRFLDPGLKHHNQDAAPMDEIWSKDIFSYYKVLSDLVGKEAVGDDELALIDSIRDRFFDPRNKIFSNQDVIEMLTERDRAIMERDRAIADKARYDSRFIHMPGLKRMEQNFRRNVIYPIKDFLSIGKKVQDH
jgi:hypothetical protein